MEGGITSVNSFCWSEERFHNAIEDWFKYADHTFDVKYYQNYDKAHRKWDRKSSIIIIEHQLKNHQGDTKDCEQCKNIPDEPQKCDYFLVEPWAYSLSEVLASVTGVSHIDGLIVKESKCKEKHQQRDQDRPTVV